MIWKFQAQKYFCFQDTQKIDTTDKQKEADSKSKETQRSYIAAPTRTLNLINVSVKKDWVSKADEMMKSKKVNKESRKVRKKRLWLQRKEGHGKIIRKSQIRHRGDWENLPDLCLEIIFQYLPFDVI